MVLANCKNSVKVTLRNAVASDKEQVFKWRNSESTRRYFFDPAPVSWETHVAWFYDVLLGENTHLLIGEVEGEPVGVLRYDVDGECAEVSIYLVPEMVGFGLGAKLLAEGIVWARHKLIGVSRIKARVASENGASIRTFKKAGFRCDVCEFIYDV